jgi:hypothetical protein
MILAIVADALQLVFLPLFVEGAESPADDILDLSVGAALFSLLGWHWEFLPSFLASWFPELIWSRSGRWRLRTSIGDRSGSRSAQRRIVRSPGLTGRRVRRR